VPTGLKRYYGEGYLHFITFSCHHRRTLLGSPARRNLFLKILEQVRRSYRFVVVGYVVMPEHVHLLLGEPERGNPSVVMQVLKQRFVRRLLRSDRRRCHPSQGWLWGPGLQAGEVWQRRFYDFVVWGKRKRIEKLRYLHRNPVKRGLVLQPEQWAWSSFRHYQTGEAGPVLVNEQRPTELKLRGRAAALAKSGSVPEPAAPTLRKPEGWGNQV
jgi:putative transposase